MRSIIEYPHPSLWVPTEPVKAFEDVSGLVEEMKEIMEAANGIGLAANQIGVSKQLFLAQVGPQVMYACNAEITSRSEPYLDVEACLSIPGREYQVTRYKNITVDFGNSTGSFSGRVAQIFQHEVDHLNGILICDHGKETNA